MAEEGRYADDPDTDADFRRLVGLRDGPGKARLRGQIICAWLPMAHRLAERERRVLYLRFFAGMAQSAIATELGLFQMHVSRLITESCRRIRESTTREPSWDAERMRPVRPW
ncbi:sigma factor-like helix-turn-helix DNA-binding protein [Streptomyces cyaneofuscatus]|uniref:sigma factor-like helix-turn-helix DNA-binding protein n=1 Tax=Streptomyces cyaneofuscatus TaxID=66883 RepID=UPI00380F0B54